MKKNGFTLAELLITIGIIGIIGAVGIAALNKFNPDKNKALYLKTSDTLSKTVKSLTNNKVLYPYLNRSNHQLATNDIYFGRYPLLNIEKPSKSPYDTANYEGDKKLCSLIGISLGVSDSALNCSDAIYAYNAATFLNDFNNNISFVTPNGMRWMIRPHIQTSIETSTPPIVAHFQTDVYVDVNPENNNVNGVDRSCIYDNDACELPDIYKFMIAANGKIEPADNMGVAYTKSRKILMRKNYNINPGVLDVLSDNAADFEYKNASNVDVPPCNPGENYENGACVTPAQGQCETWQVLENGKCINICANNYGYENGKCVYCANGVNTDTGECNSPGGSGSGAGGSGSGSDDGTVGSNTGGSSGGSVGGTGGSNAGGSSGGSVGGTGGSNAGGSSGGSVGGLGGSNAGGSSTLPTEERPFTTPDGEWPLINNGDIQETQGSWNSNVGQFDTTTRDRGELSFN